jgi:hypothetical protein
VRNGFAKIRAGLEEHLIAGRIGFFEAGVYLAIHLQADFRTGLWIGSAPRLLATAPRGASLRAVQRALERLAEIRFIRTFHISGTRGNYRVLLHKYEPQFGALRGRRLNAFASTDWRSPSYEAVAEDDADDDAEHDAEAVTEDAPSQESLLRSTKQKPSRAARAGDPRHQPFFDLCFQAFITHYGQPPTWNGRDHRALANLLRDKPDLPVDELRRRFGNFLASTEPYIAGQGGSLAFFCSNFDRFLLGPVDQRGGGNGFSSRLNRPSGAFHQRGKRYPEPKVYEV